MSDITQILSQLETGDPSAAEKLLPLVYDELRKLAAAKLAQERPGQTLQATALVHEAYLRLLPNPEAHVTESIPKRTSSATEQHWNSRGHFFAAAAEAMRRILVENAKRKKCAKRGGEFDRVALEDDQILAPSRDLDLLALDEALAQLAVQDARKAELVKLRFFAGLTIQQAAEALGISESTADADWAFAKAWLRVRIAN